MTAEKFDDVQAAPVLLRRRPSFPMQVLCGRIREGVGKQPWAGYLPDHLRPADVPAKPFLATTSLDCSTAKIEAAVAYKPQGIPVEGRVWTLSQDLLAIAQELEGHVWDAMRCPHANHVVQKCIEKLKPEHLQFVVDALKVEDLAVQASRHKYACRIVQRLVEHCPEEQVKDVTSKIVAETVLIACHPYGNYVIQHLLHHGHGNLKASICQTLCEDIQKICLDSYGCAVVSCVMMSLPRELRTDLAQTLIREPPLLIHLACSRHGYHAAKEVLEALCLEEKQEAEDIFRAEKAKLQSSRYGRVVMSQVKDSNKEVAGKS
eukprot:TRINITY_DN11294_c0_g1_i2.p1 TRINITY_DN11294_c0_g1~~TRINITY_DN11294_c0_g1_i2.p1  ORF type:complete len:319 (+),score=71.25 TRINITY_DN11294_c0_g1_i2:62-1018(+)